MCQITIFPRLGAVWSAYSPQICNQSELTKMECEPKRISACSLKLKEYRKRNASGAVYDDPRVAVGTGVLTELER